MSKAMPILLASILSCACAREASTAGDPAMQGEAAPASATAPTDRIGIARSGAPAAIAAGARIMDFDAAGNLVELRPGTNGWMCIADDAPAAPGESPDCMDARWQQWFDAYVKGEAPKISGIGVAYMLQGSLSPSNTDPFMETPPAGQPWMEDGPHMMLIAPDPKMLEDSRASTGWAAPMSCTRGRRTRT
jgi:hypothetical protein